MSAMAIAVPVDACSARVARARLAVRASSYSGVSVAPKLRVCPINPGVQHEHDDVGPNAVAIVVGCVPSGVTCPLQVHTRHRDHGSDDHAATAAVVFRIPFLVASAHRSTVSSVTSTGREPLP